MLSMKTNIDKKDLGQAIRNLRKDKGLSQRDLASQTGVHYSNIAQIEAGKSNPTLETLMKLAEKCDAQITISGK